MAAAPSHHTFLHLQPLTQFLTLAPATSSSYPAHRRTESSESTSSSVTQVASAEDALASAETIPAAAAAEKQVVTVSPLVAEIEKKNRRSSSLSSTGSSRLAGQFRFLRLGPVHHGAHIEGDDDWSEEVAVE